MSQVARTKGATVHSAVKTGASHVGGFVLGLLFGEAKPEVVKQSEVQPKPAAAKRKN
jgi:hypothetical protein